MWSKSNRFKDKFILTKCCIGTCINILLNIVLILCYLTIIHTHIILYVCPLAELVGKLSSSRYKISPYAVLIFNIIYQHLGINV